MGFETMRCSSNGRGGGGAGLLPCTVACACTAVVLCVCSWYTFSGVHDHIPPPHSRTRPMPSSQAHMHMHMQTVARQRSSNVNRHAASVELTPSSSNIGVGVHDGANAARLALRARKADALSTALPRQVVFASHHKCGSTLANELRLLFKPVAIKCGVPNERLSLPGRPRTFSLIGIQWQLRNTTVAHMDRVHLRKGGTKAPAPAPAILHVIRDPVDVILSGYYYHRSTSESSDSWVRDAQWLHAAHTELSHGRPVATQYVLSGIPPKLIYHARPHACLHAWPWCGMRAALC